MHLRPLAVAAALALMVPAATLAASIHGTARPDHLNGSKRDDRIDVVGGGADSVKCGRGADVVNADLSDRIAKDCELVTRRISSQWRKR